jgi:hypothetical protein
MPDDPLRSFGGVEYRLLTFHRLLQSCVGLVHACGVMRTLGHRDREINTVSREFKIWAGTSEILENHPAVRTL